MQGAEHPIFFGSRCHNLPILFTFWIVPQEKASIVYLEPPTYKYNISLMLYRCGILHMIKIKKDMVVCVYSHYCQHVNGHNKQNYEINNNTSNFKNTNYHEKWNNNNLKQEKRETHSKILKINAIVVK